MENTFTARTAPWMKLGAITETTHTATEAAALTGLDFEVQMLEIQAKNPDGTVRNIDERRAMIHENGTFLGIVSNNYEPVQYSEAFAFMDEINPSYVAAGQLLKGKQGFMVVEVPLESPFRPLGDDDPHDLYAVLRTSHDCSRGVEVAVMPLRGKCMNQLTLRSLTRDATHRWSFKHTKNVKVRLEEAKHTLNGLSAYADAYTQLADRLVEVTLDEEQQRTILDKACPAYIRQREEFVNTVYELAQTDETIGFTNTGWGLVNAVNSYYEWGRQGGTPQSQFLGALQGETHKVTNRVVVGCLRSR